MAAEAPDDENPRDAQPPDHPADQPPGSDDDGSEPYRPRSLPLIAETLDDLFAEYQRAFTDYDDLDPREAFVKHLVEEYGISFPEPSSGFANTDNDVHVYGVLTAGRGGSEVTTSNFAIDYNADLVSGGLDRINGWYLKNHGSRSLKLRFIDTEDVKDDLRQEAPDDADRFVPAMLEFYDSTNDGGSGNDVVKGLCNLLQDPQRLAWALEAITNGGSSVNTVTAVLGGGSGTSLTLLVDELIRVGLIDTDAADIGFNLGLQLGRIDNDHYLGQFDDGTPRYTYHDAVGTATRAGQRIRDGDASWILWSENVPLTYNFHARTEKPPYPQIRDFYSPLRTGADAGPDADPDPDPEPVARMVNYDPRFNHIDHTKRDRQKCLGDFAFRHLQRRPSRVRFWDGEEDVDPEDYVTDFHGYAWTPGFSALEDFSELEGRDIPGINGVSGHREALRGLGYTASQLLNSSVSHDEIQRANAVVHAADININAGDLQIVEEAVQDALKLEYGTGERDEPVRAILMDGLGTVRYPGSFPMSVTVYAGHQLPLAAHECMATREYKRAVNGGAD